MNQKEETERRLKELKNLPFIDCPAMYEFLTGEPRVVGKDRGPYTEAPVNIDLSNWESINNVLAILQRFRAHINMTPDSHGNYYGSDFQRIDEAIEIGDSQKLREALQSLVATIYLE